MKKFTTLLGTCLTVLAFLLSSSHASAWSLFGKDEYTKTQYPIVLVHGMFGFDNLAGIEYFYGIPNALSKSGAEVYVAQVTALDSTEARGEQLLKQVEQVLVITGAEKVNLIGHSHGGPTSRYVASVAPQYVASVTSIGGVNKGSKIADLIAGIPDDSIPDNVVAAAGNALASLIDLLSGGGNEQDFKASIKALSTADTLRFNAEYPEGVPTTECGEGDYVADNGVYYYSWSGASPFTNLLDVSDGPLTILGALYGSPNDGLVGTCSSHLGKVIRDDYKMNHLDEVNQMFGIHHLFETDPKTLYRQHANRLKNQGL